MAKRVWVKGIVQGVGFRPYIYQLAANSRLTGRVANTANGVHIHVEGSAPAIDAFLARIVTEAPPLAQITAVDARDTAREACRQFQIVASNEENAEASVLISPDVAVCADCLAEMRTPSDRRYRYPFINCTNCGPRYTIINGLPYDRPKTSMKSFRMCPECQAEYDNPADRRFHAQPNACPVCGPRVTLWAADGQPVATDDPVGEVIARLKAGRIVAIKGLGGYHLAVDAENETAVQRLRQRKQREEKPLALMARDSEQVHGFARLTDEEIAVLESPQRPILLLAKQAGHTIAPSVAPDNRYFGVMLPYTPLHHLLLEGDFAALVMTSANLSEEPIVIANEEALARLGDIADDFLVHDRDIYLRCDDSIVRQTAGRVGFIRRSRGFVPTPVFLKHSLPSVLACGAELKNTVCLIKEDRAFVSQHIGDLENLATYEAFHATIAHLQQILAIAPQAIACDMHPDYLSTRYAQEQTALPVIPVQHHHAHIVSAMAENHLEGNVIGLAFDGTGYGPDGTVWGGEVLIADTGHYERVAFLEPVPMPGSAAAIRAPWRMALSYLYQTYGGAWRDLNIDFLKTVDPRQAEVVLRMTTQGLNAPLTSSLGRLFDGVSALVGLRHSVAFEGQAAMALEMCAAQDEKGYYAYELPERWPVPVSTASIISGVVSDLQHGRSAARISRKFHTTLVMLFTDLCCRLRRRTALDRVVLSGGAFQNAILQRELTRALAAAGLKVHTHRLVPPNDGGIALGQAVVAGTRLAIEAGG